MAQFDVVPFRVVPGVVRLKAIGCAFSPLVGFLIADEYEVLLSALLLVGVGDLLVDRLAITGHFADPTECGVIVQGDEHIDVGAFEGSCATGVAYTLGLGHAVAERGHVDTGSGGNRRIRPR